MLRCLFPQKLSAEFKPLSTKLELLRALHSDVAVYLRRDVELTSRAHLGTLDAQLNQLRHKHDVMCVKLEQRAQCLVDDDNAVTSQPAADRCDC